MDTDKISDQLNIGPSTRNLAVNNPSNICNSPHSITSVRPASSVFVIYMSQCFIPHLSLLCLHLVLLDSAHSSSHIMFLHMLYLLLIDFQLVQHTHVLSNSICIIQMSMHFCFMLALQRYRPIIVDNCKKKTLRGCKQVHERSSTGFQFHFLPRATIHADTITKYK